MPDFQWHPITASMVVESVCDELKLPIELVQACKQTVDKLRNSAIYDFVGQCDRIITGAAIMMALDLNKITSVTREQIS